MKQGVLAAAVVLAFVVIAVSTFVGYSQPDTVPVASGTGNNPALAGKWRVEGAKSDVVFPGNMELLSDGTGIDEQQESGRGNQVAWKTDGNRFYLLYGYGSTAIAYRYAVSDSTLMLGSDDGKNATYKRPVTPQMPLGGSPAQSPILQTTVPASPASSGMTTVPIQQVTPPQPIVLP